MPIDLNALNVFRLMARLGGVGAAARSLRITQSAVSQRLAGLERSLGRKLYGRAGRGVRLTEDGRTLYESCRNAFDALEAAELAFSGASEAPLIGTVRIASLSEAAKTFLLPQMLEFRKRHPAVVFNLVYRLPYEMLPLLLRGEIDCALTNEAYRRPQVETRAKWIEEVVCVGRGPARRLGWRQVQELAWIAYGADDPLRYELETAAHRAAVRLPKPTMSVADVDTVIRLAAAGAGHALVPDHALRLQGRPGLATFRLPVRIRKTLYLSRISSVPLGRAAQAFWDCIK